MLIKNLTRLPRVGEMLPIWLKLSLSAYSQSIIAEPRVHMHDACNCTPVQLHASRRGAAAHNACAYTETASPCEETTKRETTKEGSTKKEDKKKRRKEDGLPSVGQTDTTETRVSAKNALRDGEKVRSPRRSSTPPSPPSEAVVQPVRTSAVTPEEARATPEYWAALGAHRDAAGGATGSGEGRT